MRHVVRADGPDHGPDEPARQRVIEAAMYAFLGFLAAGLLALLLLPAVWGRAVRLTREAVLATHPSTYREVKAAQDALRAEAALTHRRLERELDRLKTQNAQLRAETGRNLPERLQMQKDRAELSEHRREVDALLAAQTEENTHLREDLAIARSEARELALALEQRKAEVTELRQLLESRKGTSSDPLAAVTISALEAQIVSLQRQLALRVAAPEQKSQAAEALAAQVHPDADAVALRKTVARLETELMDKEADFIAAQADVARLTLQLDLAGGLPDGLVARLDQDLKEIARDNARLAARAAAQDRALTRTRAEIGRLRQELASSPAVTALRDDLKQLAARVVAGDRPDAMAGDPPAAKAKAPRQRKAATKASASELPPPATPAAAARLSAVEIAGRIVRASAAAREALAQTTPPAATQPRPSERTPERPAGDSAPDPDAAQAAQAAQTTQAVQTPSPAQTAGSSKPPRGTDPRKKVVA
ncbi:hypothetical protein GWI72_16115 [Microvirga tunisiensis]|uniref:Uncharacterized protein n=1 Tax=Pannonibacter tanglangensis TaxID=2750084 RepID=A0A7X5J9S6_9HYPH|nr:hypothetical protein [Pannonibacter sp. XCT-53]NBN79802.1 hypothetical protein [Pannonibacter sp. XCT-53]